MEAPGLDSLVLHAMYPLTRASPASAARASTSVCSETKTEEHINLWGGKINCSKHVCTNHVKKNALRPAHSTTGQNPARHQPSVLVEFTSLTPAKDATRGTCCPHSTTPAPAHPARLPPPIAPVPLRTRISPSAGSL